MYYVEKLSSAIALVIIFLFSSVNSYKQKKETWLKLFFTIPESTSQFLLLIQFLMTKQYYIFCYLCCRISPVDL